MPRLILKIINFIISTVLVIILLLTGTYAVYSLWDNARIYNAAEDVQADMLRIKPEADKVEKDGGASFEALKAVNNDVRAWLTLDDTKVDYPVLQGENNLSYLNTDVYGNFALAGSIYMDSRNKADFSDRYVLLYGHHMDGGRMFGDLDKFKTEKFFKKNTEETTGQLILPDRNYQLQVFAVLVLPASDSTIFSPMKWKDDISGPLEKAANESMFCNDALINSLYQDPDAQIIALTTCTSEFTDARTIVLAVMKSQQTAGVEE